MGLFGKSKEKKPKETLESVLEKHGFEVTKCIYRSNSLSVDPSLYMDDNHKKWAILKSKKDEPKIYGYANILNIDVKENGTSKSKGHTGQALIGGALLGPIGAIAGAAGKKKEIDLCKSLSVFITINDPHNSNLTIDLINSATKIDSLIYRLAKDTANQIESDFEYMKSAVIPTSENPILSVADEIKKYKDLLDAGAITQEDYTAKKEQLLAL